MRSYHSKKTPASNALTDLIRAVLHMSAHAQKIGTLLTKDLNLSNARWQTLGELNACQERLTVSQLARLMGLTRQSVQPQRRHQSLATLKPASQNVRWIKPPMVTMSQFYTYQLYSTLSGSTPSSCSLANA